MKGFNMKKLAALGIGAALVGSALAPVVSAAAYNNLDTLEKSNVVTDAGVPVVDVVGGSNAMPSDIVWAGNIATRIAQLATIPSGDAPGAVTVDVTVGGTLSTVGVGNEDKNTLDFRSGSHEFAPIKANNGDIPMLADEGSWEYKWAGDTVTISIDENVVVNGDVMPQTQGDGLYAGELVMDLGSSGDIVYHLDLGDGIPVPFTDDSNSSTDIKLKMLGDTWMVRQTTTSKIVLRRSTASEQLFVGDTITVPGIGDYEGKDLTIEVIGIPTAGVGNTTFESEFAIMDGSTVLATAVEIPEGVDLKDEEFEDYTDTSVVVDVIAAGTGDNRYVRVISGEDQVEIHNNKMFPFDASAPSSPIAWKSTIVTSGSRITDVTVQNQDLKYKLGDADYSNLQGSGSDLYRMGPLPVGGEIDILGQEKVKFIFSGLEANDQFSNTIGEGKLNLRIDGSNREIPLFINLGEGKRDVTVAGKPFTVDVNADGFWYFANTVDTITNAKRATASTATMVNLNASTDTVDFAIDLEGQSVIEYRVLADHNGEYYLVLDAQTITVDNDSSTPATVKFLGTATNEVQEYNDKARTAIDIPFYLPDISSLKTEAANLLVDYNINVAVDGYAPGDPDRMYQAVFEIDDASTAIPDQQDVNVFVDTSNGSLADVHNNTTSKEFGDGEVVYGSYWTIDSTATTESELITKGTTMFGAEFSVEDGVLTFVMPNELREVKGFIGGSDTTSSVVGGETLEGLADGETASTTAGTDVTVNVTGGSATGGVAVVNAGDLVRLDTSYGGGRAVIVGGYVANTAAVGLDVMDGQTLEDLLVANGDYVAYVLDSGSIVVAGKNANDTGTAASALIDALEALM